MIHKIPFSAWLRFEVLSLIKASELPEFKTSYCRIDVKPKKFGDPGRWHFDLVVILPKDLNPDVKFRVKELLKCEVGQNSIASLISHLRLGEFKDAVSKLNSLKEAVLMITEPEQTKRD